MRSQHFWDVTLCLLIFITELAEDRCPCSLRVMCNITEDTNFYFLICL